MRINLIFIFLILISSLTFLLRPQKALALKVCTVDPTPWWLCYDCTSGTWADCGTYSCCTTMGSVEWFISPDKPPNFLACTQNVCTINYEGSCDGPRYDYSYERTVCGDNVCRLEQKSGKTYDKYLCDSLTSTDCWIGDSCGLASTPIPTSPPGEPTPTFPPPTPTSPPGCNYGSWTASNTCGDCALNRMRETRSLTSGPPSCPATQTRCTLGCGGGPTSTPAPTSTPPPVSVSVDVPLTLRGIFIANEFELNRDLGAGNSTTPAETFYFKPSLLFTAPPFLMARYMIWEEVAP